MMINKGERKQNLPRMIIKQLSIAKKILRGILPFNWFEGFLDDLKIDLKELMVKAPRRHKQKEKECAQELEIRNEK